MTGDSFLPDNKKITVAAIVLYEQDGDAFRYTIAAYSESDIRQIKFAADYWQKGFVKGGQDDSKNKLDTPTQPPLGL